MPALPAIDPGNAGLARARGGNHPRTIGNRGDSQKNQRNWRLRVERGNSNGYTTHGQSSVPVRLQQFIRQTNITRDRALTASEACEVLDRLQGEIDSSVSDRDVRQEAAWAIDYIKGRIRSNASFGISGRGFGQTWDKKEFRVGNYTYRVDFELSGDIKE